MDDDQVNESNQAGETSRRGVLRAALLAAGGAAAAAVVLDADPAAATLSTMTTGATTTEDVNLSNFNYVGSKDGTAFLFQAGSTHNASDSSSSYPSALGGWTTNVRYPHGVYGYTNVTGGAGVVGAGYGPGGIGVLASGVTGLVASTTNGFAVSATATIGFGVTGTSHNGTGVVGTSYSGSGMRAVSYASGPALSTDSAQGAGIETAGTTYALNATSADTAALHLDATTYDGTSTRAAPPSRTDAHLAGEIDVDGHGDLWCCVIAGTPGTWRKLAGTATAGSFHPLTPGRVYDSRVAAPGPVAPLATGANRLVSVSGRRALDTGTVVQADFVPAGATAITANVTVVDTVGGGFLTVNPGGTTTVNAATINWSASDQILNNGVTLTLNATRQLTVIAGGDATASTHFVIDVTGYYL